MAADPRGARRGTARTDLRNGHIFNPGGFGAGVWAGSGVTRTKPSRTLFITALPAGAQPAAVQALFKGEPGYQDFRSRRAMCFVDFESVRHATAAMRKVQGHRLPGASAGLAIDFDKDHVSKRNREYEKHGRKRGREGGDGGGRGGDESDDPSAVFYYCACCGSRFCSLVGGKALEGMPKRRTDGSSVVMEEVSMGDLWAGAGEVKLLKREKGVERQYPLNCSGCEIQIAYRPVPLTQRTRFMYILPGALSATRGERRTSGLTAAKVKQAALADVAKAAAADGGDGDGAGAGATKPEAAGDAATTATATAATTKT